MSKNRKKTTKVEKEKPTVPVWFQMLMQAIVALAALIEAIK